MIAYTNYLTDARPRREAETLVARGDEVAFVSLSEKDRPATEVVNGVLVLRQGSVKYRGASKLAYIFKYVKFFFQASFISCKYFFSGRASVIYVHTMPDFMVFAALIPKLFGAKVVLDVHDMMPELFMSKFGLSEKHIVVSLIKLQERLSCALANAVICVHEPHKQVLLKRGINPRKLNVVINVPDPVMFGATRDPIEGDANGLSIVYHGTIAKRLGLDLAVSAFALVIKIYPEAKFFIYGDGDAAPALKTQIASAGLERSVIFTNQFFKVEDIPALVGNATAGVIPNRRDLATEYMLPVKLLEYVHLGIPVVAPQLLTIMHYFPETTIAYYKPGDVQAFADTIVHMLASPEERREKARLAKTRLEGFAWHTMKYNLFNTIDNLTL